MRVVGVFALLGLVACATSAAPPPRAAPEASSGDAPQASGPASDRDGDGISDRDDKCPADAETLNGHDDTDGCPDLSPLSGASTDDSKIIERVTFRYDSAQINPASFAMLDAIAVVLKMQPQKFPLVALEGHAADNEHTTMKLSLARASAVRVALLARGVDVNRLLARASGTTAPACNQQNEGCWARERSVEFVTLAAPRASAPDEAAAADGAGARAAEKKPPADTAAASMPLERVEFKKGSAVLEPAALANLDVLAGFMKATASSLEIVGYADDSERKAATLAAARADAVRRYMLACGVSAQHLTTRAERTGRAACRTHSANCSARAGRTELRFVEPQAPAPSAGAPAPPPPAPSANDGE